MVCRCGRRGLKVGVLKLALHGVVDHVDEVGSLDGLGRAFGDGEGRIHGELVVAIVDESVLAHQAEHEVAAVAQVIGMAEGVEVGGPAGKLASSAASGRVIWLRSLPRKDSAASPKP